MSENDTLWKVVLLIGGAIVAMFGWIAACWTKLGGKACKSEIIGKAVCEERSGSIRETVEEHRVEAGQRHTELKTDMHRGFTEVKTLIRNGGR